MKFKVRFDKSNPDKLDFRQFGRICGNGYTFGGLAHINLDPSFDASSIFRRDSKLAETHRAANALHTAHSRPFYGSIPPTEAPSKKPELRIVSETC